MLQGGVYRLTLITYTAKEYNMFPTNFQPANAVPPPREVIPVPKKHTAYAVDQYGNTAAMAGYDPRIAKLDAWGNWYYPSSRNWV